MYNQKPNQQEKLRFSQIDLNPFADKSSALQAKLLTQKIRVLTGLFKLVSLVNMLVSIVLSQSFSTNVGILAAAVVVILVDWVVQVVQAGQVLKRDYVADIFINKMAYDYYVMASYKHYCFYQKVNSQLPAKCQGRVAVHRDLSSSFNTFASFFVVVYGITVKPIPSSTNMDFHYVYWAASFLFSLVTVLGDVLSTLYSAFYYVSNRSDFHGTLENWCLEYITKSLLILNLVDGNQLEEATTIVLFNAEYAKNYRPNRSWGYYMIFSVYRLIWHIGVIFALNMLIPYTILTCEIYSQPGFDNSFILSLSIGYGYALFVIGRFMMNASRAIQIINNRDLTSLLTHGFTCDFFQLTSFNRFCFIEDAKLKLGQEMKKKLFIYHNCSEILCLFLMYALSYKYILLAYTFIDFDYPLGLFKYQQIADQVHQSGITNKNVGPYGDGRFIISDATFSPYEFYSACVPLNFSLLLFVVGLVISFGWFYLRKGMSGPTEKCLKEQIRTLMAPNQSKFRQI
ncbi:hypothetical protein HDV06_002923 [Boothiomyces sp. JEL0866]|nr:hypothetical protein HDV06_002923 [Boothiomyces sp. JEL0866]